MDDQPPIWLVLLGAAVLIIGTVNVVTALGVSDARPDLATLSAVGAPAGIRRRLAGWSALLVTGIGCLLGGALGLVPAWGLRRLATNFGGSSHIGMVVPWVELALLAVGLPILAFVLATLFTRSRAPLVRRLD